MKEITFLENRLHVPMIYTPSDLKNANLVIMCHGFGSTKDEVANMFVELASKFRDLNIASIRFDFCGHGESDIELDKRTYQRQIDELKSVIAYACDMGYEYHRIALLGFSLGAKVIGDYLNECHDIDKIVAWSGAIEDGLGAIASFEKDIDEEKAIFRFTWRDDLFLSRRWYEEIAQSKALTGYLDHRGSILFINGIKDEIVPIILTDTLKSIKGAKFLSLDCDHTFNALIEDRYRDQVMDATIAFLKETFNQ